MRGSYPSIIFGQEGGGNLSKSLQNGLMDKDGYVLGIAPHAGYVIQDTFITGHALALSQLSWLNSAAGTGAALTPASTNTAVNAHGGLLFTTGTTNTGIAQLWMDATSVKLAGGALRFEMRVNLVDISTGSEEYAIWIGLTDTLSPPVVSGVFVSYDRANDGVNWFGSCIAASTETQVDLGVVVVEDAYVTVGFDVNAAGSSVQFRINGAEVGTAVTTNIPTADLGASVNIEKSVGTTARLMHLDHFYQHSIYTTPWY